MTIMYNCVILIFTSYIQQALILHYIGCPTVLRVDNGTENTLIGAVQYALRESGSDRFAGERSFIYGGSTTSIVSYCILTLA